MVSATSLERRVGVLEDHPRHLAPMIIPVICAATGQTSEEAVARYVADAGALPEVEGDQVNAIVLMPVPLPSKEAA